MAKRYRVEYGNQFRRDLDETVEYIVTEYANYDYADILPYRVYNEIERVAERGRFARSAKYATVDGVDCYRIIVDKYIVIYELHDNTMYARRLIHSSRDIRNLL